MIWPSGLRNKHPNRISFDAFWWGSSLDSLKPRCLFFLSRIFNILVQLPLGARCPKSDLKKSIFCALCGHLRTLWASGTPCGHLRTLWAFWLAGCNFIYLVSLLCRDSTESKQSHGCIRMIASLLNYCIRKNRVQRISVGKTWNSSLDAIS